MKHCIFRQTYRCRRCYIGGGGWGRRLSDFVPQSQSLSVSVPVPLQFCTLTASSCNVQPHISAPLSLSLSLFDLDSAPFPPSEPLATEWGEGERPRRPLYEAALSIGITSPGLGVVSVSSAFVYFCFLDSFSCCDSLSSGSLACSPQSEWINPLARPHPLLLIYCWIHCRAPRI